MGDSKAEEKADGDRFDDWAEGLCIVKAGALMESFCNQSGFISVKCAIRMMLETIDPFATNNILRGLRRNKFPGAIGKKGIDFISHGLAPKGFLNSLLIGGWFQW